MTAKKLIIINDNIEGLTFLPEMLEKYGFQVTTTSDAEKALVLVKNNFFDVIVTDISLPNINGAEYYANIRKISPLSSIVLTSSESQKALVERSADNGPINVADNKLSPGRLLAAINTAAKRTNVVIAAVHTPAISPLPKQLLGNNLQVYMTFNNVEMLESIAKTHPEIVFIDKDLPGMDSIELLRSIRLTNPDMNTILIVEHASPDVQKLCMECGGMNWVEKPLTADKITAAAGVIKTVQYARTTDQRILLVEDDHALAETIGSILADAGYQVDVFEDGETAVDACREKHYDALLADFRLPSMTGIEVIRSIKDVYPDIVTILMTAFETMDVGISAICEEVNDLIPKPFDPSALIDSLRKALAAKTKK